MAERANDVEDGVARFETVEQRSGFPDGLHNDGDCAGCRIGALDGEGNAFALLMKAENHELARPLLAGDAGRLDDKLLDIKADAACFDDLVHEGMTPVTERANQLVCAAGKTTGNKGQRRRRTAAARLRSTNLIIEDCVQRACDLHHEVVSGMDQEFGEK